MFRSIEPSPVRAVSVFLNKVDHTPRFAYSLIWYPGRENVTLSRRPLACVKVPKFLKVLDKSWGVLFRLFIDMSLAPGLRVDDIPLSQGLPFKYARFVLQFDHKESTARLDIPDTGEYHSLLCAVAESGPVFLESLFIFIFPRRNLNELDTLDSKTISRFH